MKNMLFHVSGFFFYHLLTSSYELIIYNRFFCKVCLEVFFLIKVTPYYIYIEEVLHKNKIHLQYKTLHVNN